MTLTLQRLSPEKLDELAEPPRKALHGCRPSVTTRLFHRLHTFVCNSPTDNGPFSSFT